MAHPFSEGAFCAATKSLPYSPALQRPVLKKLGDEGFP